MTKVTLQSSPERMVIPISYSGSYREAYQKGNIPHIIHKNQLYRCIVGLSVNDKRRKPPEETLEECFQYFEVSQNFLTRTHKALMLRENTLRLKTLIYQRII